MFKKQFPFRRRRDDGEDDDGANGNLFRTRDSLAPFGNGPAFSSPSRSPSPGSTHRMNTFDRSLTSSEAAAVDANNRDPVGLRILHRPPGDRTVDIIFVHGLGGSSRGTWTKNRDLARCWPLQFLPLEPGIGSARILTFGYNSKFRPGAGKSQMSILDFAKDLLYDLKYAQDETASEIEGLNMGEKPILFVVHSMGGLIVKEAYIQGQNDPAYEAIIKSVSSIIFLSTPHRGTNLAEVLNRILQVSFATNPMKFIAELAAGSQTLQKLNEQFRHIAPRLQIVSFYETRPTSILKKSQIMVLEKDSSMLGYPGEVSKPLDADHNGICKYESPEDHGYITVRNALKSLISKTQKKTSLVPKTSDSASAETPATTFDEFLSIDESPEKDYNFFRDRWTFGTCGWVVAHDTFSGWLDDTHQKPRVLWVQGNAASGKSILSSFIIDHLTQLGLPCHYFFVRFTDQKKRGLSMILRSLACQLANSIPDYAGKLRQLEAAGADLRTADSRNVWQWLYKQTLFRVTTDQPIYCVIDGVDEADSPGSLIRLLSDLHLVEIPLRFLVVSRKTHEISSGFQKLAKQVHMETIRLDGNQDDFRSYIDSEMDVAGEGPYREEVTAKLLERARGNFLWVHLAVQRINSCHTTVAVEEALKQLPAGMEALYDRMASSVTTQTSASDRRLALSILGWATCACRVLAVEELSDALDNHGLLEIHRTIGDLCGGFVVVDAEGKVSMIHETAREYLTSGERLEDRPLTIDGKGANDKLLQRCIQRLTDPGLRAKMMRNQPPALLHYAVNSWFRHFSLGSSTGPDILRTVVKFLQSPHVLTWIQAAAKGKELRALVVASRYLADVVLKLQKLDDESLAYTQSVDVLEGWATDLAKVVGKFGNSLIRNPDAIHKLIPPFCPQGSIIYQQFGRKESKALSVSGFTTNTWDDCLTRLSLEQGAVASAIIPAASRIAVLTNVKKMSHIIIYDAGTFEEKRRIIHPERVLAIQLNKLGDLLVSYGYLTTRVWEVATGNCIDVVKNPPKRPRPHTLGFADEGKTVLAAGEDRCVRAFPLRQDAKSWAIRAQIDEQALDDATLNFPLCSAISPDGTMIAYGYRVHPVTVWEIETQMLVGQCSIALDETDMTIQESTFGEVCGLAWHPFSGEVFGLNQVGLLFKWNTYEDEACMQTPAGGDRLTLNQDGSLIATGDGVGTLKIFQSSDLTLLYQLSAPDPILHLSFSTDSRRIYDIRGPYGNVWEPNTLARLSERAEYPDHNSDAWSETTSLAKVSIHTEHHFARVDSIITLAGQAVGPLYCYGTEDGVAALCEVGKGEVAEVERLKSFMSIEQVAWSEDGKHLAVSDLSGKLAVKRISRSDEDRDSWEVRHELDLVIPPHQGHISQLLFHPTGDQLVAATPAAMYGVSLSTRSETQTGLLEDEDSEMKWMCHPTLTSYLLGFGATKMRVLSWEGLREVDVFNYFPPRILPPTSPPATQPDGYRGSAKAEQETVTSLVSNVDSGHVLLKLTSTASSGPTPSQYILFEVSNVQPSSDDGAPGDAPKELTYTVLPPEVASRIREPLAFLSRRRLVFLDVDRWICTWRLPTASSAASGAVSALTRPTGGRLSEGAGGGIEQHYLLPGDWVAADEARLCSMMPDGTLLCPRNGDVATVQFAKLRK